MRRPFHSYGPETCKMAANVIPVVIAQALAEKGALDGAALGISAFLTNLVEAVQARPYLWVIIIVIVLAFLLKPKR